MYTAALPTTICRSTGSLWNDPMVGHGKVQGRHRQGTQGQS
jgi:hypothetical protein